MYHRLINISNSHSFFLFGARGTGKSTLLKQTFGKNCLQIDLLDQETFDQLIAYPSKINEIIESKSFNGTWIVIDEIQKAPKLLDIVHKKIEEKKFKFALTGSSARKLKRGQANLLAGRAFIFTLFPLTHLELGGDFNLQHALQFGTLPEAVTLKDVLDKRRFLKSYAQTYLKEEILSEQLVRNLPPFKRFLEVAGSTSSEIVNYSNIARDILSDAKTVSSYYQILEDTLLGFMLPSFHLSVRKQQKKAPKFYFFDTGVLRAISNRVDTTLEAKTFEYGLLFENFVVNEINRLLSYQEKQFSISYLRTKDDVEIDLIIERAGEPIILCEIKSTTHVDQRHSSHLEQLSKSFSNPRCILLSLDQTAKKIGTVDALHWTKGIREIIS